MLNETPISLPLWHRTFDTDWPENISFKPLSASEHELLGVWRLVDSFDMRPNGEIVRSRGQTPRGILVYDDRRHMAVQVMNDGRPGSDSFDPAQALPEQNRAMLTGYTAYFGTFEVNEEEGCVLHHMDGNLFPHEIGTTRKRFYRLIDDRLTLTTPPFQDCGESRTRRIVWERLGPVW